MEVKRLDATGLTCPQPVLKISVISPDMQPGQILEVIGDCPAFEKDVRVWRKEIGKDRWLKALTAIWQNRLR